MARVVSVVGVLGPGERMTVQQACELAAQLEQLGFKILLIWLA